MRDNVKVFVKCCAKVFTPPEPIVEIGSLQVPGQIGYADLRPFFEEKTYIGCDMCNGPGVDKIENVEQLTFNDETVGCIIIVDTLEHVENPHKALDEIHRVIKREGIVIMASPQNFPIHDYPRDFWRFTPEAFSLLLKKFPTKIVGAQGHLQNPHTVFGIGLKRDVSEVLFEEFKACLLKELSKQSSKKAGYNILNKLKTIFRPTSSEELGFYLYRDKTCVKSFKGYLKS